MVMAVEAGGPGAAADVRQGDVIVAWNGKPLEGVRALGRSLGPDSVGTTVGAFDPARRHAVDRAPHHRGASRSLSKPADSRPIVIALDLGEPELEAQLRALLEGVPGVTIASAARRLTSGW